MTSVLCILSVLELSKKVIYSLVYLFKHSTLMYCLYHSNMNYHVFKRMLFVTKNVFCDKIITNNFGQDNILK